MPCDEYQHLLALVETKRQAYTYIRLQETKVSLSKARYDELVKEAYDALTHAIKDSLQHQRACVQCRRTPDIKKSS